MVSKSILYPFSSAKVYYIRSRFSITVSSTFTYGNAEVRPPRAVALDDVLGDLLGTFAGLPLDLVAGACVVRLTCQIT